MDSTLLLAIISCLSLVIIAATICIITCTSKDRVKFIKANSEGFMISFYKKT